MSRQPKYAHEKIADDTYLPPFQRMWYLKGGVDRQYFKRYRQRSECTYAVL